MDRQKLLVSVASLVIFIFFINILAIREGWYGSLGWFDMPMHFLGGLWLGLATIYFLYPKSQAPANIFKILLAVLFIGILWEGFEVLVNQGTVREPFDAIDTFSDLCFDLLGGVTALSFVPGNLFNNLIRWQVSQK